MSFQFAVKFLCGRSEGKAVAPGEYWTAVNVRNPTDRPIGFKKRFAIAWPGERAGDVTDFFGAELGPDEALEIDRDDLYEHVGTRPRFLKGFVVINSDVQLDVVAVYSAIGETGGIALHVERVMPTAQHPRE